MTSDFTAGVFRRKAVVQAWRIDFANQPLPQWVNDAFRARLIDWLPDGAGLQVKTKGLKAANGDILIRDEGWDLLICPPAEFGEQYEMVEADKRAPARATVSMDDMLRVACISLNRATLVVLASELQKHVDDALSDDGDETTYSVTFKNMTRAQYEALKDFDGF